MEVDINGEIFPIDPKSQSDEWLIESAHEIAQAARLRGLEIPAYSGELVVKELAEDRETVAQPPIKELLLKRFGLTARGYKSTIDSLNKGREPIEQITKASRERLIAEFEEWFTEDKQQYVTEVRSADPSLEFTLVATPNLLVDGSSLVMAAKEFGENQPHQTVVWEELESRFTSEQMSGTDPDNGKVAIFSLIPSKTTYQVDGTVKEQRDKLDRLKREQPFLKIPSLLEAITLWQTLRAGGATFVGDGSHERTYISHFDLPIQTVDGWEYTIQSFVDIQGGAVIYTASTNYGHLARIAVG